MNGHHQPSRRDETVFAVKSTLLKARRSVVDLADARARRRPRGGSGGDILSEVVTALYTDGSAEERGLQLGKVQNLRVAARAVDGVTLQTGEVFSFWAQIGRPTRAKGYVEGRELRQGCLIPTIAGGLCQLSNSLFQVAKQSGCKIVERHGHTAAIPDSPFPQGEDATVFWNYVDLRFKPQRPMTLRVRLTAEDLVVQAVAP